MPLWFEQIDTIGTGTQHSLHQQPGLLAYPEEAGQVWDVGMTHHYPVVFLLCAGILGIVYRWRDNHHLHTSTGQRLGKGEHPCQKCTLRPDAEGCNHCDAVW